MNNNKKYLFFVFVNAAKTLNLVSSEMTLQSRFLCAKNPARIAILSSINPPPSQENLELNATSLVESYSIYLLLAVVNCWFLAIVY